MFVVCVCQTPSPLSSSSSCSSVRVFLCVFSGFPRSLCVCLHVFVCVLGGFGGGGVCHLISTKIRPSPNHHHLLSSFFLLHPYIPSSLSGRLTVLFRLRIRYRFFDFGFNFNCSMLAESRKIYIVLRLHCISFFSTFF